MRWIQELITPASPTMVSRDNLGAKFWAPLANESDFLECGFVSLLFSMYFLVLVFLFYVTIRFMCHSMCLLNLFLEHIFKKTQLDVYEFVRPFWGGRPFCALSLASLSIKTELDIILLEISYVGASTTAYKESCMTWNVFSAMICRGRDWKILNLEFFALIRVPDPILTESRSESTC